MSLGTLSSDQQAFVDAMATASGLNRWVVVAWVGAESGWGITKASHNYLNVRDPSSGSFRVYQSAQQAGASSASLITGSHYYAGVRAAIPAGPVAQVEAIQASPWDANHYYGSRLLSTYRSVVGSSSGVDVEPALDIPGTGIHIPGTGSGSLNPVPDAVTGYVGGLFGHLGSAIAKDALVVGLTLVFTAAAFGLIGVGVYTITGGTGAGRSAIEGAGQVAQVAQIAKLAAV